jgi:CheY-like chemotaxis protein
VHLSVKRARRSGVPEAGLERGERVLIQLQDDGPGIPADVIEKVFDPFFTTKGAAATGLGLALCWGLVEQAGGSIRVDSALGEGATFEVDLPLEVVEKTSVASMPAPQKPDGPGAPASILVVDDEGAVRRMVCLMLQRLGYSATGTDTGAEALSLLTEGGDFQLVLTDWLMPEMSGLDLIRHMRAAEVRVPALLMSGYSPDHQALRDVPREQLLSKPFKLGALRSAVARALEAEGVALQA